MSYVPLGGWLGIQARGGRSMLRLESCGQPIAWGAQDTRRLSSEPEVGFEVAAADCLRPRVVLVQSTTPKEPSSLPCCSPTILL